MIKQQASSTSGPSEAVVRDKRVNITKPKVQWIAVVGELILLVVTFTRGSLNFSTLEDLIFTLLKP